MVKSGTGREGGCLLYTSGTGNSLTTLELAGGDITLGGRNDGASRVTTVENPVSYTHLDVYKRQDQHLFHQGRLCGRRGGNHHPFQQWQGPGLHGGNPVSYTHLDVYKRQAWSPSM